MICRRPTCCGELSGKQTSYCSLRCSKLHLKSLYRKRRREHVNEYNRQWRAAKNGGDAPIHDSAKYRDSKCLNCGAYSDLQLAHIKPLFAGGKNNLVVTFCRRCHASYDNILRDFWKNGLKTREALNR